MYHLYHTEALVLGGEPQGEGSKRFALFTRELGFLSAVATSVREERSKLRYGLQDFSYSETTLVRGKEFWRLTRAELILNVFEELHGLKEATHMLGRIFALLRRLLAGEEKNEPLFVAVLEGVRFVAMRTTKPIRKYEQEKEGEEDVIASVEIILVLRILYLLGYLAPRNEFDPFLSHADLWDESVISKALLFRTLAISEINESLRQTQL